MIYLRDKKKSKKFFSSEIVFPVSKYLTQGSNITCICSSYDEVGENLFLSQARNYDEICW